MNYPNGQWPPEALATVPGRGVKVRKDALPQVVAFCEAFEAEFGRPLVITDGYRPLTGNRYAQVDIMLARYRPLEEFRRLYPGWPTAAILARKSHPWNGVRRYLLPGLAQVAFPGTSKHGTAEALDLGSGINVRGSREHAWAVENAPRFGFRWPSEWARAAGEFWHFEMFAVVPASSYAGVPGVGVIDIPTLDANLPTLLTLLEESMSENRAVVKVEQGGQHYLLDLDEWTVQALDPERAELIAHLLDIDVKAWDARAVTITLETVNAMRSINGEPAGGIQA